MSRVPPHDADAETALLGAMLLNRQAREIGVELLASSDFYLPKHAAIFAAVASLLAEDKPADRVLLLERLTVPGVDEEFIEALQVSAGSAFNVAHYAGIVARKAAARRAIALLEAGLEHAWSGDTDGVLDVLDGARESIQPPLDDVAMPQDAADLADEDHDVDWIVRGLLARHEEILIVAEPGSGKSLLLNQFATCLASGLHPWTRGEIPRRRVLVFDFQDSRGARGRSVQRLLRVAGRRFQRGWLFYELRSQGADLTTRADQRWFEAKVAKVKPDVIIAGPLYNMVMGAPARSKQSEETAQLAGKFIAELVVKYECAILVEAHAPHGEELRVRGSKYWEDWAGWGFGLRSSVVDNQRTFTLERFRGDRETGRQWPTKYVQGHPEHWPWEAPPQYIPKDPSGGTEPMEVF